MEETELTSWWGEREMIICPEMREMTPMSSTSETEPTPSMTMRTAQPREEAIRLSLERESHRKM